MGLRWFCSSLSWPRDYEYLYNGNFTVAPLRKVFNLTLNSWRLQIVALNSIESIRGFRPANNFESSIKFLLFLTSDLLVWVKWRWEFLSKLKSHVEKFFSKNRFHQKVRNSRENRHRPIPRRLAWNKSELWKKILHRTLHHFNDES